MCSTPTKSSKSDAYEQSINLLQLCCTADGFLASPTEHDNYRRVWARDGVIISLAALLTDNQQFQLGVRKTLETLAQYQGIHGEIPSNIDTITQRVSYGGTTGRVDASLWFVIGCGEYWQATGDNAFIEQYYPVLEKVRFLLGAWEFNNRGLLYVPQAGDWADEYIQSGYVLYDQLLYLQAQRALYKIQCYIQQTEDHIFQERITHLKHLIQRNYWFYNDADKGNNVYHEVLYEKGLKAVESCRNSYWLPFFAPSGYGYRFDAFANVLVSLFGVAETEQSEHVDNYISKLVNPDLPLLPAFHPVIEPKDDDWKDLQMTFSYTFKNNPYEYHNAGLWPMITGFYVADLAQRGKSKEAASFLEGIDKANASGKNDEEWSFYEYFHGEKLTPGGTRQQGWSAAASIIGHHSLKHQAVFRINEHD